jgi:hypothetical protein
MDEVMLADLATAGADQAPMYLRVAMDELRIVGRHELLDKQVTGHIAAGDLAELFDRVLQRVLRTSEPTGELVSRALSHLWIARRGLSENELRELLGDSGQSLPALVWSPARIALTPLVVYRGGVLSIVSASCRIAVERRLLASIEAKLQVHRQLLMYFRAQPPSRRRFDEAPWHAIATDDARGLLALLLDVPTLALLDEYGLLQWRTHARWLHRRHRIAAWCELEPEACMGDPAAMVTAADLCASLGNWSRAERLHARGLAGARERADLALALRAGLGRAAALAETESAEAGLLGYRDLQALAAAHGWQALHARALAGEATMLARQGDLNAARRSLDDATAMARRCGDGSLASELTGIEGAVLLALAERAGHVGASPLADAVVRLRVREQDCRQNGDILGLAAAVLQLAMAHDRSGDVGTAMQLAQEAEERHADLGDHGGRCTSMCLVATLLQRRGDLDAASAKLLAAEELAKTVENHLVRARVLARLAELWADPNLQRYGLAAHDCEGAWGEAQAAGAERFAQLLEVRCRWYRARARE